MSLKPHPLRLPTRLPTSAAGITAMARTGVLPAPGPLYPVEYRAKNACVRRGDPTGETVLCPTCTGRVELKVLACSLNGGCLPTAAAEGRACCATCDDYLPANSHPNIIAADAFRRNLPPYPEGKYSGRGVVVSGGGSYWASTYVTVRMLRHVGCTLPVQVWYLGAKERDDRYTALLKPFGVAVVDMLAHPEAKNTRCLTGWPGNSPFEGKSFAVLHSPFEEVLSLDADCYPCQDPTALFDEPGYRSTGGVFWPDQPHTEKWTRWHLWGVEKHGPEMGFEVGVYLLNKRLAWGQLNLTRWYDDHGDWCYGGSTGMDHGDKGPHRTSWAAFKTAPTVYATRCRWDRIAYLQPGPDGKTPWFVHRCGSKFSLAANTYTSTPQSGLNIRAGLPGEDIAFRFLDELRAALGR